MRRRYFSSSSRSLRSAMAASGPRSASAPQRGQYLAVLESRHPQAPQRTVGAPPLGPEHTSTGTGRPPPGGHEAPARALARATMSALIARPQPAVPYRSIGFLPSTIAGQSLHITSRHDQ